MLMSPVPQSYLLKIFFPDKEAYNFQVLNIEDLIFQIMSMNNFEKTKESFKELKPHFNSKQTLYPLVLVISKFDTLTLFRATDPGIINPKSLWQLTINQYFYHLSNDEGSKQINFEMHRMLQFRTEEYLEIEVLYEDAEVMTQICRFNGICKDKSGCNGCDFHYNQNLI